MLVRVKKAPPRRYGNFFLNFESVQDEEVVVTQSNRLIRDIKFVGVIREAGEDEDDENAPIAGEDEIPDDDLMAIANGGEPSGGGGAEPEPNNVPDDAGGDEEGENAPIAGEDEIPDNDLMAIANGGEPAGDSPVQSDGEDFTAGGGGEDAPTPDGPATDGGDNTQDFTAGADTDGGGNGGNPETADDGPVPDGDGGDGPATDDGQDFTDGADADGGGDGGGESDGGGDSGSEEDKPGVDYDSMRRYCLYKEFIALHNSVEGYINKLEGITKDNVEENRVLFQAVVHLREIRNLLSDYMTMKFKADTYFASRLFYQKMIVSVQLVFRAIKTMSSLDDSEKRHK